ncbi:MAG: hypothetical protein GQ574_20980 [Crocinitomix sp.]|nr:hypothetical protein [Crocinitomix sp.]
MNQPLAHLADHARIWIFQSDRFLTAHECEEINKAMHEFIPNWASHGNDLYGGFALEKALFLIVGVDETKSPASGCSIDSLTRVVKDLGAKLNINFFNRLAIAYEDGQGKIEIVSMADFKRMLTENKVDSNTIVFNNLVNTRADFDSKWRTSVQSSWHSNLLQLV